MVLEQVLAPLDRPHLPVRHPVDDARANGAKYAALAEVPGLRTSTFRALAGPILRMPTLSYSAGVPGTFTPSIHATRAELAAWAGEPENAASELRRPTGAARCEGWTCLATLQAPVTQRSGSDGKGPVVVTIGPGDAFSRWICEPGPMTEATARVTLRRLRRPVADVLRAYRVLIDGAEVGEIRRGQTVDYDVAPGAHKVHLEIDWCASHTVALDLAAGQEAQLECKARPPMGGWSAAAPSGYISLEVIGPGKAVFAPPPRHRRRTCRRAPRPTTSCTKHGRPGWPAPPT